MKYLTFLFLFLPTLTLAEGLVPCGGESQSPCTLCHLFSLVQNIIHWGMGILTFLAFLFLVIASILYIVSSGNTQRIDNAKQTIKNTLKSVSKSALFLPLLSVFE